mgnify:CR=1 FL=1
MGIYNHSIDNNGQEELLRDEAAYILLHCVNDIEEAIRACGIDGLNAELATKGLRIVGAPLPAIPATTGSVQLPF